MFEICHSKKCFYFLILERYRKGERVIETNINLLFHLCIHWLLLVCALTGDQTHNLGILGQHSNHLSYPSRAEISHFLKRFYLLIFRGEGREKEKKRNTDVWLPLPHLLLSAWPATQACALTGNQTSDPLIRRPIFDPLSYTSQG